MSEQSTTDAAATEPGRHRARRNAMMLLYQLELVPRELHDAVDEWQNEHGFAFPSYANELVVGVQENLPRLDEVISKHLVEWTIDRLGAVERSILRIALYEMLFGSTPVEVAIDEAVELAKRYASPEAAKLTNGVLGSYVREGRDG